MGLDFAQDGFLRDVLELSVLQELRQLKHKTRIPVEKVWHVYGVMYETGILKKGQIFCTVVVDGRVEAIIGKGLLVARSPALHPGNVQIVEGIEPPADPPSWQLHNCICFSQHGARDLPSQLGGGDLDGMLCHISTFAYFVLQIIGLSTSLLTLLPRGLLLPDL